MVEHTHTFVVARGKRNSNIELLRFVLMFTICILHLLVHGVGIKESGASVGNVDLLLCALSLPAVNCFMLISGYYGIRFSVNKALTLILQAFIIFVFCSIVKICLLGGVKWTSLVQHLFPIANKNWWFLTEYFCIMLLSPLINKGIERIDRKTFTVILLYLLFINSFGLYMVRASLGSNLLSMLIVYLLGRYMSLYKIEFGRSKAAFFGVLATALLALLVCGSYYAGYGKVSWLLFSYNNPLILLQAVCSFCWVKSLKERHYRPFQFLGKHAFSVYLITEALGIGFLYPLWASWYEMNPLYAVGGILAAMALCIFIDCLQDKLNEGIRVRLFAKYPALNF